MSEGWMGSDTGVGIGILAVMALSMLVRFALPLYQTHPWFRIAVIWLGFIPMLIGLIIAPLVLRGPLFRIVFRTGLVFMLSILPMAIYFMFHALRRQSLVSEFISNLDRLGLAHPLPRVREEASRRARLAAYLREFDGLYGPLDELQVSQLAAGTGLGIEELRESHGRGVADGGGRQALPGRETQIPILLATFFTAMGWFVTLPPLPDHEVELRFGPAPFSAPASAAAGGSPRRTFNLSEWIGFALDNSDAKPTTHILEPQTNAVTFAFLGAYFFALQALFWRYLRRDLSSRAYVGIALRIVLAVVGVWAVTPVLALLPKGTHPDPLVVGFMVGVMPNTVLQFFASLLRKFPPIYWTMPALRDQRPISELDGLTIWHASRLKEEDVENVPNMATADPAELMIRTRIAPDRIIDWIDQAMLLAHLPPPGNSEGALNLRARINGQGVRTASMFVRMYMSFPEDEAFAWLDERRGRQRAQALVLSMRANPHLGLIQHWRGLSAGPDSPRAALPVAPVSESRALAAGGGEG